MMNMMTVSLLDEGQINRPVDLCEKRTSQVVLSESTNTFKRRQHERSSVVHCQVARARETAVRGWGALVLKGKATLNKVGSPAHQQQGRVCTLKSPETPCVTF